MGCALFPESPSLGRLALLVLAGTKVQRGVQLEITNKFDLRKMTCSGSSWEVGRTWKDAKQVWVVRRYSTGGGCGTSNNWRPHARGYSTYEVPASSGYPIPTKKIVGDATTKATAKPLLSF